MVTRIRKGVVGLGRGGRGSRRRRRLGEEWGCERGEYEEEFQCIYPPSRKMREVFLSMYVMISCPLPRVDREG